MVLAILLSTSRALAEDAAAAEAGSSAVEAPRLRYDPGVVYPDAALKSGFYERVKVELVLEIARDGSVSKASVAAPLQPVFAEAAHAAALRLRFAPALKHGTPVAARIRFRYVFEAPAPVLSGRVVDDHTSVPVPGARITIQPAEGTAHTLHTATDGVFRSDALPRGGAEVSIEVSGRVAQRTSIQLTPGQETRVEVRLASTAGAVATSGPAPAPSERPVEVVVQGEKLAPAVSSFSRAEVRQIPGTFGDPFRAIEALPGVTPIASGLPFFYVRGAPPGNVGYFLNGVRIPFLYHVAIGPAVVHPGIVERVDLYPGGYPASFGRFAGGIVSAETTAPRAETHGEANVRLFDAGALVETGFDGGRGTVLLGGRYSYTAALFSLLVPEVKLDYRDYQARVTYDVTSNDRLSLFGLGSYDLLAQKQGDGLNVLFGAEFYRLSLAHEHAFDAGALTTSVTLGYEQTYQADEGNASGRSLAVRTELQHALGRHARLRAGADIGFDAYSAGRPKYADPDDPELRAFERSNPGRTDRVAGVFSDVVLRVAPGIEVTPGLRVDWYASEAADAVAVEPRLAARFQLSQGLALIHAYGVAHQPPSFALPLPGRRPATLEDGLQTSLQTSAGAEVDLGAGTLLTGTVFYNTFLNMTDGLATTRDGPPDAQPVERSLGSALGFELFVRRRLTRRLGGFLSYTLSRSMRSVGRERFPSAFDRTHVANAAVAYDLGRAWRAGTRLVFYTGAPELPEQTGLIGAPRTANPDRGRPFFRLDLRLEKRWQLGSASWISFVTEVMNTTLSRETFGDVELGPITIPSIGVELGF